VSGDLWKMETFPDEVSSALEELRHDAEKKTIMMEGAIQLLARQASECMRTGTCSICIRPLETEGDAWLCMQILQEKRARVEQYRDAEAIRSTRSRSPASELGSIKSGTAQFPTISAARKAFYSRTGELFEWRQQKHDCISAMRCFSCFRSFTMPELPSFLARMDRRAAIMESELHMHPKFCPVEEPRIPTKEIIPVRGSKRLKWMPDEVESAAKRIVSQVVASTVPESERTSPEPERVAMSEAGANECDTSVQVLLHSQDLHPQELMI